MSFFQGMGVLFTLIALFGTINQRYMKLPDTLGITAVGLVSCLTLSVLGFSNPDMVTRAQSLVVQIDFADVVFHGLLSFLLFAGGLHVDLSRMRAYKLPVFMLATVGVLVSTAVVGMGFYLASGLFGHPLGVWWCFVFGALISPTDPIAVLSVLKSADAPQGLETKIAGEALFNDGTAVVAFMTLVGLATGNTSVSVSSIATSLAREIIGACAMGALLGYGACALLRRVDSYPVEILITLALATAGYSAAEAVHVSAPLAMVIIGLVVGNLVGKPGKSAKTQEHLSQFWTLFEELLILVLFGLIGLEVIALALKLEIVLAGIVAIPVVLLARALSVGLPLLALQRFREVSPHTVKVMTWGGLRGGISIALALSLPSFEGKELIIGVTYLVVVFSLLVQATTLGALIRSLKADFKS
jgi:CPA1 family monovalent cation:H+ antiporter